MVRLPVIRFATRQTKPFADEDGCLANRAIFTTTDKVENIAAGLAVTEAIPAVLFYTDPKLSRIRSIVEWACASQTFAVLAAFEPRCEVVMIKDLKNRDGLFDRSKINIVRFGHRHCLSGCALVRRDLSRFYPARAK